MLTYIVRALKPIKAGTKGFYDMLGVPLIEDAPAGRRVRMECAQALKAASAGHVEMLSPDGIKAVSANGAQYKTRVQQAETPAAPVKRTRASSAE